MTKSAWILTILSTLLTVSICLQGVDVDSLYSTATYECIHNSFNLFAIIKGTVGNGAVDPRASQNLYNAASAGLLTDVKFMPCRSKNITNQVDEFLSQVSPKFFNTVWI